MFKVSYKKKGIFVSEIIKMHSWKFSCMFICARTIHAAHKYKQAKRWQKRNLYRSDKNRLV